MHTFNFLGGNQQSGPASSTPANDQFTLQPQVYHPISAPQLGLVDQLVPRFENMQTTEERFPGVMSIGRRTLRREFLSVDPDTRVPGMILINDGAAGGTSPGQSGQPHNMPENIQAGIDQHRAVNQNERLVTDKPVGSINITDLRGDPFLRGGVENIMEGFVRQRIPSLTAAPSVQTSSLGPTGQPVPMTGGAYSYDSAQLHQVRGDGTRVTDGSGQQQFGARTRDSAPIVPRETAGQNRNQPTVQQVPVVPLPPPKSNLAVLPSNPGQPSYPQQLTLGQAAQPSQPYYSNGHPTQQQFVQQRPQFVQPQPTQYVPLQQYVQPRQCMQPQHLTPQQHAQGPVHNPVQYSYDWVTDSVGRQIMVRTPLNQARLEQQQQLVTPPQQQYRTEYRCSPTTGRQWSIQVPVDPSTDIPATQQCYEWRINAQTGDRYQILVPYQHQPPQQNCQVAPVQTLPGQRQQLPFPGPQQNHGYSPDVTHHNSDTSHQTTSQLHDASLSRHERVAGIVSLLEGGGGTKKVPKVLEFAKKCPTRWSKQATLNSINLPLYAWGVLEEVEASLSGRSQAMQSSVILGKLRHLKNTFEVCCQNSTSQDFTGYGWTLAKDYATKMNDEIEQGRETWQDMRLEVKTSTLMSASMENPRPAPRFEPAVKKVKQTEKKEVCPTYNKCTTENKCDYEVTNPTKTCLRKHECSWCRSNKNQSWSHQASRCRGKAADGSG